MSRRVLVAAALAVFAATVPSASAATPRVFTLGRTAASVVATAPDGTVYAASSEVTGIRRLRRRDSAFMPLDVPRAATGKVWDLLVAADGALLWVDGTTHRVWRRAPDGTSAPVAGLDGVCPMALASTPAGGLLVVDNSEALRLLDPGAPLRTLWPAGAPVSNQGCFDGSNEIVDVAVTPDGTAYALRLVDGAVLAVTPDGSAHTALTLSDATAVSAASDGSVLVTAGSGIARWRPVGPGLTWLTHFTGNGGDRIFDSDGLGLGAFGDTAAPQGAAFATADGGFVLPTQTEDEVGRTRIAYVPGAQPGRLAVALRGRLGRSGRNGYRAALLLTRAARVHISIVRGSRTVAGVTRSLPAGASTVTLGGGLAFGAATVQVIAAGRDGQAARDSLRLFLGTPLTVAAARGDVPPVFDTAGCGIRRASGAPARAADCSSYDVPTTVAGCIRRSARRVDCAYTYRDDGRQCRMHATRLTPVGALVSADAELTCPRTGRVLPSPRWRVPASEWGGEGLP